MQTAARMAFTFGSLWPELEPAPQGVTDHTAGRRALGSTLGHTCGGAGLLWPGMFELNTC